MRARYLIAGTVLVVGVGTLLWRVGGWFSASPGKLAGQQTGVAIAGPGGTTTFQNSRGSGVASRDPDAGRQIIEESIRKVGALDAPDAVPLGDTIRAVVGVYLAESADVLVRYCDQSGIAPIPSLATDPESVKSAWAYYRKWFDTAILDHENIKLRWREIEGRDVSGETSSYSRITDRPGSRRFWEELPTQSRRSIEVIVPFTSNDLSGKAFAGRLGVEIAHDPARQQWVLLRFRVYDVPNGYSVVDPPV